MPIAILATGDEIVHGDTLNTNSHEIAKILSSEGLPLSMQLSCSDKKQDIIRSLQFLLEDSNIVILIGGLGPTTDDLTRFALAGLTNAPLVPHEQALNHIQNILKRNLDEGNLQQCLFPKEAQILPNPYGTAVGGYYPWEDKVFFLLPGPPRECLPMFHQQVLPILQKTEHSKKQIIKWQIFGMAESEIAQMLEGALASMDCQTGYRLDTPYLEFKVRCKHHLVDDIKAVVDPLLAPHIITKEFKKASTRLVESILSLKEPIRIVDNVTGGLLQSLIMKPETASLLDFNGKSKTALSFELNGLTEYWSGKAAGGSTEIAIHYSNTTQEGGERHSLPYRSPLVLSYAAEWLSFRLFHLINQLH